MSHPVSIRINILTNFVIVVGLIALSLLGLEYFFSQKMARSSAHQSFTQTAQRITQYVQSRDGLIKNMLSLIALYPDLTRSPMDANHIGTIRRLTLSMQRSANIYAMYIGHPDGDFFEVINMSISSDLHKHFQAPDKTRWTIIKIYDSAQGRTRQFDYLDNDLDLISSRVESSTYYANKRAWFIQASKSDQAIRTDAYLFTNLQQKGITFAKVINDSKAVLAIDFTLKKLSSVFNQLVLDTDNELLMFGTDGKIIASSNNLTPDDKFNFFLARALKEGQTERIIRYKYEGKDKFALISALSNELGSNTYIAISSNAKTILEPYFEQIIYSLAIAVIFLLFTIPFILYMTSRIIKPIKALMVQNNKIKERHFSEVTPIDTNISELIDLSDSLVSMSQSIQSYQKAQEELMDSFIRLIADAIDAKSSYTGGHCQRVPEIAIMLAKIASESNDEAFKDFKLENDDAWREFQIGAWLHDCGKVTTPEYVVDKSTKLETIYNRIHEIRTRFEVIWRDIEIEYYQRLSNDEDPGKLAKWKHDAQQVLQDDFACIAESNMGGEFLDEKKQQRIRTIAQQTWSRHFNNRLGLSDAELERYQGDEDSALPVVESLLDDKPEHLVARPDFDEDAYHRQGFKLDVPKYLYNYGELYNLLIEKGTLTDEERFKINEHVIMTIKMLDRLPYPEHLQKIPEYAGSHHETMNGTGYPRQLIKSELSIPARIMAIADIFEALTASDRPYKRGKTLSEAIGIMGFMNKDQHIDSELFELFLRSGIYKEYAEKYLTKDQNDEVNIETYLA